MTETTHGYSSDIPAYTRRLNRIEGQVRGVSRMIQEDQYCIDVLTQISAINKALHSVGLQLLEQHMHHCVAAAAHESPEAAQAKIAEATAAIGRLMKS